jgi:hypothetical protein
MMETRTKDKLRVPSQRRIIETNSVAYLSHLAHTCCHWDAAGQALVSEG